ncbi:hypothetical protein JAAARDRAFT_199000 [Jaapia argillacea MUCL 33604]|uniref:Uncharacterized protein n=1 Tax=Jaapia argillacea MUCL 33604 TaxID=933084 RepID=A0A067P9E3_9AGAM|nr:hypothetical protein JAAARDRAFT_199000 [Jaapia argillacea MUCL 33604]
MDSEFMDEPAMHEPIQPQQPLVDNSLAPITSLGRPVRSNRGKLPTRFRDILPEGPAPLPLSSPPTSDTEPLSEELPQPEPPSVPTPKKVRTEPNSFGLLREFLEGIPAKDPEDGVELEELSADGPPVTPVCNPTPQLLSDFGPYPNKSAYLLGNWYWTSGAQKSKADLKRLVKDVIGNPDFNRADLPGVNWDKIDQELGSSDPASFFGEQLGWKKASVPISIPFPQKDLLPKNFVVEGLMYKSLTQLIRSVCESEASAKFQWTPYRHIWKPPFPGEAEEVVHGEVYTSPSFHNAHTKKHYVVNSKAVNRVLQEESWVPTSNAFSDFCNNVFKLFVPDFLHEWESGVWKAILTHLIRLLHSVKGEKIGEFNARFCQVPVFGQDTIRRFHMNVGELRQFAARDYEDVLQCIIPVFEGLLPDPHNHLAMDLLFLTAYLHGLRKLWMHTDSTLSIMDKVTVEFGKSLRKFVKATEETFHTVELPKEKAVRLRRQANKAKKAASSTTARTPAETNTAADNSDSSTPPAKKEFNLNTYKLHSLGDYATTIHYIGTNLIGQARTNLPPNWRDFVTRLKDHLLQRLRKNGNTQDETPFTNTDRQSIVFQNDRIYIHRTMHINFTTYDVRQAYDNINPKTDRCDVMVLAKEDDDNVASHPFWYARVIGIYHVNVVELDDSGVIPPVRRVDFLHVRWFGRDLDWWSGWKAKRLDRIGFIPESDEDAFGFLDPADVIRGCHLIPAYAEGRTRMLLRYSLISQGDEQDDWERFYVNRFVDRDMIMQYIGRGVGHLGAQLVASPPPLALAFPEEVEGEDEDDGDPMTEEVADVGQGSDSSSSEGEGDSESEGDSDSDGEGESDSGGDSNSEPPMIVLT